MTRADLLRRQTKPPAANGCRPKGYARLSVLRRLLGRTSSGTPAKPHRPV